MNFYLKNHMTLIGSADQKYSVNMRYFTFAIQRKVWGLFMHFWGGIFNASIGTKRFNPKLGNSELQYHMEIHQNAKKDQEKIVVVPNYRRKNAIRAAYPACAFDLLSFSCCGGRQTGMFAFTK